jgi:hypothetical protein
MIPHQNFAATPTRRELMKISAILTALVALAMLAATAPAQTPNAPEKPLTPQEQQLISLEKDFIAAAKKGDPAFFKRTLADDFSFVAFDGELGSRQDMIDGFAGGGADILPYDMKVLPVSDAAAIVTYDVVFRVPPSEDEGPPPRYQHFSTLWVKQGDAWKMKFMQMTVAHFGDW